ncbi:ABC transporter ATP-binding protein [Brachybacterium endophyticum]|nr:ABC transporter ATP-binding protein [Brachybacterium endophyticum]
MTAQNSPAHPPLRPPTAGPAPVLAARGLQHAYGDRSATTLALDGVDLDVAPAESLAVMGPSGCGKTTLLHVLAGILRPTSGSVLHAGSDLSALSESRRTRLRRTAFGFVFQDGRLLPELTALENAILPRMLGGAPRRSASAEAASWLDRLGLQGLHDRRPGQLSGGQAQRVAIARALGGRPSVVFADEPTGALDQATGHSVLAVLADACRDAGAALVMVTHDPSVASTCERTIAMRDGRIARQFQRDPAQGAAPTQQVRPDSHQVHPDSQQGAVGGGRR